MRRRDFLRLGVAMPAVLATRRARGQPNAITRAAVVIGVDRPIGLTPLNAAVSGAKEFGNWLESEGIKVARFLDETKPVKAEDIFDAIDQFVSLDTLQQLIVYFAGHGSFVGTGEYWLLSQALHNSNQAVSVTQCIQFSRQCGVPNVVLISDACRSTSASLGIQALTGYNIFPVKNNRRVFTYLDTFFAARQGAPAYEIKDTAGKFNGIYTTCFRDAYLNPEDSMVEEVNGVEVVPNKKLEKYLLSVVPKIAQISNVLEYPDSSVTSSAYIGRVEGDIKIPDSHIKIPDIAASGVPPTINDLAEFKLNQGGVDISRNPRRNNLFNLAESRQLQKIDESVGFTANSDLILNARGPNTFRHGTGINVFGAHLRTAVSSSVEPQVLREGNGSNEPAVVQINPRDAAPRRCSMCPTPPFDVTKASVALEFENGSGTVIAALPGYVATVVVAAGTVVSVSYEPAQVGDRLSISPSDNEYIKKLHALVATSAKFGALRIDGPPDVAKRNAQRLADAIRVGKTLDPTLGLYACYAYAEAGVPEQIRSVYEIMKEKLGIVLFDIAMLADQPAAYRTGDDVPRTAVPFCPMLNQGWQYLTIKNVTLPRQLSGVQEHIIPSLWTTFDSDGMGIVKAALLSSAIP